MASLHPPIHDVEKVAFHTSGRFESGGRAWECVNVYLDSHLERDKGGIEIDLYGATGLIEAFASACMDFLDTNAAHPLVKLDLAAAADIVEETIDSSLKTNEEIAFRTHLVDTLRRAAK